MMIDILVYLLFFFFFFKQKTAYEMRISDWSSDVCSSDLLGGNGVGWKRVVGGGEDRRLGVLDVHVLDLRQVADAAGDDDVAFVLDSSRLGAALEDRKSVV